MRDKFIFIIIVLRENATEDVYKRQVKKAWDYNLRAWKIYAKMRPKLFVSYICEAVLAAAVPYAGIWLSARFVDELAGRRDAAMLWKLAGTLLLTELVLGICLLAAKPVSYTHLWIEIHSGQLQHSRI